MAFAAVGAAAGHVPLRHSCARFKGSGLPMMSVLFFFVFRFSFFFFFFLLLSFFFFFFFFCFCFPFSVFFLSPFPFLRLGERRGVVALATVGCWNTSVSRSITSALSLTGVSAGNAGR